MIAVPENFWRYLLYGGIALYIFAYTRYEDFDSKYSLRDRRIDVMRDSLNTLKAKNRIDKWAFMQDMEVFCRKRNVPNLFYIDSNGRVETYIKLSQVRPLGLSDTFTAEYTKYMSREIENMERIKSQQNAIISEQLVQENELNKVDDAYSFELLAIILALIGLGGTIYYQIIQDRIVWTNYMKTGKVFERCQSCFKKFDSVVTRGKDSFGEKSNAYCNTCYADGQFKEPELKLQEMKQRVIRDLMNNAVPKFRIRSMARAIENLERWKKNRYL